MQTNYSFECFDQSPDLTIFIRTLNGVAVARQSALTFWNNGFRPSDAIREISDLTGCLHGEDCLGVPYLSASSSSEGAAVLTLLFMTAIARPDDSHIAHLVHEGGCA